MEPLNEEEDRPQTGLEKFAQNETADQFCKRKMAESAKEPPALSRRPGGGGKIYGQNSAEQFKLSSPTI